MQESLLYLEIETILLTDDDELCSQQSALGYLVSDG